MNYELLIYSIIIGAIGGGAVAAGAARMFHAPEIQSMGAFRTLGELNACNGDPVSHFSMGLGFFFNAAATALASGALTQDVLHRVIPNWSAAVVIGSSKDKETALHNPAKMAVYGASIGAVVVSFLNSAASLVPEKLAEIGRGVLGPATSWLINPVMPVVFWLAAIDAGKVTGIWATVLGGVSTVVSGNALPGIVLGILVGKSAEEHGYNSNVVKVLITIVVVMFGLIAYFRGFHKQLGL